METGLAGEGKRSPEGDPSHAARPVCGGHLSPMDSPLTQYLRTKVGTGHKTLGENAAGATLERDRQKRTNLAPGMAVAGKDNLE